MTERQATRQPSFAIDTSVAIPILLEGHDDHELLFAWSAGLRLALAGHALAETYSVLTRMPLELRLPSRDVARALTSEFVDPVVLDPGTSRSLPRVLSELGVAGGAVYDAMVALAAKEAGLVLATRDSRALGTYRSVGVEVEVVS